MKKILKILVIFILCLAFLAGAVAIWQRDQIKSLIIGLKYSDDELSRMMSSAQNDLKKAVEEHSGIKLRDYSIEELKQIESGKVTKDEVISKIINEALEQKSTSYVETNDTAAPHSTSIDTKKSADAIINEHVAKLYSLKSSYIGKIDAILAQGSSEYYSKASQGNSENVKKSLLPKYISKISGLEGACDSEVEAIISSLTKELKALNHPLDIIKTIRSAYAKEKNIKKAQIISRYS